MNTAETKRIESNIWSDGYEYRVEISKLGLKGRHTCLTLDEAKAFKQFVKEAKIAPKNWSKAFVAAEMAASKPRARRAARQLVGSATINPFSRISPLVIYGLIAFNLASIAFLTWLMFFSGIDMKPREKIELPAITDLSQASLEAQPEEQPAAQEPAQRAALPEDLIVSMGAKDRNNALKLYVFADPTCGACKELEPALEKMPDVAITIIPTPILETGDRFMGGISCAKDKLAAWKAAINEGVAMDGSCATGGDAHIRAYNFFKAAGFGATPTLIAGDGRIHAGSMSGDVKKIRAWLAGGK